jgi:hypothetical protein
MAIRVQVPVVIELDDGQQQLYARRHGLGDARRLRARDFVDSVQARALEVLKNSPDLQDTGITLKR